MYFIYIYTQCVRTYGIYIACIYTVYNAYTYAYLYTNAYTYTYTDTYIIRTYIISSVQRIRTYT